MNIPEHKLISDAREGDMAAFGALYERYLDDIYRYVYSKVQDHPEAEDLTETVFLRAWDALPRFRPRGVGFKAWLYRIAHNAAIDHHRTRKPSVSLDTVHELRDGSPSPQAVAEAEQQNARLASALAGLKPNQQRVILYRFVNGLSHAETAEVMGIREGHVRVLQYRALRRMRQLLSEGTE